MQTSEEKVGALLQYLFPNQEDGPLDRHARTCLLRSGKLPWHEQKQQFEQIQVLSGQKRVQRHHIGDDRRGRDETALHVRARPGHGSPPPSKPRGPRGSGGLAWSDAGPSTSPLRDAASPKSSSPTRKLAEVFDGVDESARIGDSVDGTKAGTVDKECNKQSGSGDFADMTTARNRDSAENVKVEGGDSVDTTTPAGGASAEPSSAEDAAEPPPVHVDPNQVRLRALYEVCRAYTNSTEGSDGPLTFSINGLSSLLCDARVLDNRFSYHHVAEVFECSRSRELQAGLRETTAGDCGFGSVIGIFQDVTLIIFPRVVEAYGFDHALAHLYDAQILKFCESSPLPHDMPIPTLDLHTFCDPKTLDPEALARSHHGRVPAAAQSGASLHGHAAAGVRRHRWEL
ncbi:hypothetical protein CYMTET_28048 [Cymbomonas tetramitiformis]|uniref:Uncharacterized protein n=1 Tax=Cymbomonas tetramitiformis TaxID=36881 RepID=A0AAE0FP57_9CHLO|nr:hypothetical protein CYMTET_28048 [Cymbomonas tetramitiformis]